jgi:hypothetical protein
MAKKPATRKSSGKITLPKSSQMPVKKPIKRPAQKPDKNSVGTRSKKSTPAGAATAAGFNSTSDESMHGLTDAQIVARIKMHVDLGNRPEFYLQSGTLYMHVK